MRFSTPRRSDGATASCGKALMRYVRVKATHASRIGRAASATRSNAPVMAWPSMSRPPHLRQLQKPMRAGAGASSTSRMLGRLHV